MTKLDTTIVRRTLADLTPLDTNARYMRQETYQRLVENLREDGELTSTPLIYSGGEYDEGRELILSGNHRVQAAVDAGIVEADCKLITQNLPKARQVALQLSHNAIEGEDDIAILKQLYESIEDIDYRGYAGLDDKTLELLDKVDLESLSEANLDFHTVQLTFLPPEADAARDALESLSKAVDETWLAAYRDYNPMLDALAAAHSSHNIGNVATALGVLIALTENHLTDLQEGYLSPESAEPLHQGHVGLEVVFGSRTVPATTAAAMTKALKTATDSGEIEAGKPWQLLDKMIADWMNVR
ncbi:hypothetical protein FB384_004908 [Prauserella sediminis]|uniref:ParB/Sulfiredoxin domain-containing protein n=1 Tax=Prauserella sediminis TaxID=577680 RepID=A0A839XV74_9PSEU|nr:ParB N-terminal domain-containing protein [Prauserella sediminis]MBB3665949.1 hypothetical protein [Prauserella sediminis]